MLFPGLILYIFGGTDSIACLSVDALIVEVATDATCSAQSTRNYTCYITTYIQNENSFIAYVTYFSYLPLNMHISDGNNSITFHAKIMQKL